VGIGIEVFFLNMIKIEGAKNQEVVELVKYFNRVKDRNLR
jgi:hypothetical protein|tara:strand:+ start:3223 stop:3342 length:120 start_codon:yes stop_codon:yes gene_type:complete